MKDAFFRWWQKVSDWIYVLVTGFTYFVYSLRQYRGVPALSREEKEKIRQYWKQNYGKTVPLRQYAWFKAQGLEPDPRLLPDLFWHINVEPAFTNLPLEKGFRDKNYFETIVGKEHSPDILCRCINSQLLDSDYAPVDLETACRMIHRESEVVCKPSIDSGGGRSILFVSGTDVTPEFLESQIRNYRGNFVVQKILKQHSFMQTLNASSLNTMRIVTFLYQGKVHLLSAAVRVGGEDSRVDNLASGGVYIYLHKDGRMQDYAIRKDVRTKKITKLTRMPNGFEFAGLQIPGWEDTMDLLNKMHFKLPHFQIINWDVALREDGNPVIIEYNLIDSSPMPKQLGNGPIFGDLTESVLQDLARKRKNLHGKTKQ